MTPAAAFHPRLRGPRIPAQAWDDGVMTTSGASDEPLLLSAIAGRPVPRPPVWFMRQAGRSLPEYRRVRAGTTMLQACWDADLVTEITLQPVRRYGVDAAIFYSDIVVPLRAAGIDLDIVPGTGPVIANPVRSRGDVDRLPELHPDQLDFVTRAVEQLVAELGPVPLIGFAGAPFTLASYLVEGGPSRNHERTKALMYGDPETWHALLDRIAQLSTVFLRTQAQAGARVVQLFDSWVGALPRPDYLEFVEPHSRRVLQAVGETGVPRIHFGTGTGELLDVMGTAGADVVGVDHRLPLATGIERVGPDRAVQGNLDPALLFAPWEAVAPRVREIVEAGRRAKGHVFNLGHGVLPDTDPDMVQRVVDEVVATEDDRLGS